jgi:Fe-S cluster assembly protein SufD
MIGLFLKRLLMEFKESTSALSFLATLKHTFESLKGRDGLEAVREKAWNRFLELGLPDNKQGAFQYVPLKQLYANTYHLETNHSLETQEIKDRIYPESLQSYLVFVKGVFRPDLSDRTALPSSVVILPLADAMRTYGTLLQNRWSRFMDQESDPFTLLNLALHPGGLFVYVPPKVVLEHPIQCLHVGSSDTSLSMPRVQLFAGAHAEVTWITRYAAHGLMSHVLDLTLEEGAKVQHLVSCEANSRWNLSAERVVSKANSRYHSWNTVTGGYIHRTSYQVALMGEQAEADINGLSAIKGNNQSHTHVEMQHKAPHTRSLQKFKVALDDISQSSFEGKIFVDQLAQKTQAYQLNNNLLLGTHAVANSKPTLEIFADDVKASHGATCTQVEEEQLFYLKSRGISEQTARQLLIQGFCKEMLDQIPVESVRKECTAKVLYAKTTP